MIKRLRNPAGARPRPAILLFLAGLFLLLTSTLHAQFTAGNIAVFQADVASSNNTTGTIIQLNTTTINQSPVTSTAISDTGTSAMRFSGSASSTCYMANSNDGSLLCFTGGNSTNTTDNSNTLTTRAVGTLNASGIFGLNTTYTGISGNQSRCATIIDNNNNIWFIADQGGVYSNGAIAPSPTGNFRGIKSFGGTVYVGQQSGTTTLIQVSTLSAATGGTITGLPGLINNNNFQDFYLISSGSNGASYDILYTISNTKATAGTINKYSLVGGTWTANGSYTTTFGGFGLAAKALTNSAELYITTGAGANAGNSLIKCTDAAGYNAAISITTGNNATLYTAPAAATIKGVALAPVSAGPAPTPKMRITEYMYSGKDGEFAEFTNVGSTPIDMTGWSYSDNSRHPGDVPLSAFGTVQPGESVILTETAASDFRTAWGLCTNVKVIGGNSIDNMGSSDEINIYDASQNLVDRLTYTSSAPGVVTKNISGWVNTIGLGANDQSDWTLSSVGDAEGSVTSTDGDIGSPGKSARATVSFNPCSGPIPGAPTIAIDVANTSDLLDGGITTSPVSPYAVSGVMNDPNDPAGTLGLKFIVGSTAGTDVSNLTVAAVSSNPAVGTVTLTGSGANYLLKMTATGVGYSNFTLTVTDNGNHLSTSYLVEYAASQSTGSSLVWSTGMADASAAIALDDDHMVIADDEDNLLYVYNRKISGLPITTYDFNQNNILALTDGNTNNWKELDLEATAPSPTHAGRAYWFGSMSNSSSFNNKPNRDRIVAIDITGSGAAPSFANVGTFGSIRGTLISWGNSNNWNFTASSAEGTDPKTIGGFNVEGTVFGPDNTSMYVGFRAPLVPKAGQPLNSDADRTMAVIAPVQNFESWFNNGNPSGTPAVGAPILLDLGKRGIRDLIRLSNGTYVIVAGSYDGTQIPALFKWSGNAADAPTQMTSFDITGFNAEAAMGVNQGGQLSTDELQIVADNGDDFYYNDGVAAKDLTENNFKKFRSGVVLSSDPVALPVDFASFTAQRQAANVQLDWTTGLSSQTLSFDVQRSVNGTDYTTIATVPGLSGLSSYSYTDVKTPAVRLYYRIQAKELSGKLTLSTVRIVNPDGLTDASLKVYPNPVTNGVFTISLDAPGLKTVNIYTSTGLLYQQVTFSATAKDISTASWSKGYYLLRIQLADGSVSTEKVVVQ